MKIESDFGKIDSRGAIAVAVLWIGVAALIIGAITLGKLMALIIAGIAILALVGLIAWGTTLAVYHGFRRKTDAERRYGYY